MIFFLFTLVCPSCANLFFFPFAIYHSVPPFSSNPFGVCACGTIPSTHYPPSMAFFFYLFVPSFIVLCLLFCQHMSHEPLTPIHVSLSMSRPSVLPTFSVPFCNMTRDSDVEGSITAIFCARLIVCNRMRTTREKAGSASHMRSLLTSLADALMFAHTHVRSQSRSRMYVLGLRLLREDRLYHNIQYYEKSCIVLPHVVFPGLPFRKSYFDWD